MLQSMMIGIGITMSDRCPQCGGKDIEEEVYGIVDYWSVGVVNLICVDCLYEWEEEENI